MTEIHVPQELLDTGSSDWFPKKGNWEGVINKVHESELPSDEFGNPYSGYVTTDGEQISLEVRNLTPMNGQDGPPGDIPVFIRLTLRDGEEDITTLDVTEASDFKQLRKSIRRLASLAPALGQRFTTDFIDSLRAGEFDGQQVGIVFANWKNQNGQGAYPRFFVQAS